MSKITFCADNKVLDANLSILAGAGDAQFPLKNIQHDFTTKVFRSTGNTVTLLIDLRTIHNIDIVCIKGSSIDCIGFNSCTIEGSATLIFPGVPVTVDISNSHNFAFKEFSPTACRYWKLVFTGSTYVEVSNIYLGKKTQLTDNAMSIGFQYAKNTNYKVAKNAYGQKFIDAYNTVDTLSGEIKYVNSTEFDQLNAIQVQNGETRPIWFLLDPEGRMGNIESEFIFSGYFYMKDLQWKSVAPGLYDVTISLEEAT